MHTRNITDLFSASSPYDSPSNAKRTNRVC